MYRPIIFLVSCTFLLLFSHCKEAQSSTESKVEAATEKVAEPVEKAKATAITIDSAQAMPTKIAAVIPPKEEEKVVVPVKVASKTGESVEIKKEPKVVPKKKRKRSKIKFEETTHKFGTIKTGDKVDHTFKFKNTGNAPLVIKSVDVSCGCTFPSYPFLPIEPGDEAKIDVSFNSKGKVGRQKPTVTVVTNGRPRTIKLYMEGFVE